MTVPEVEARVQRVLTAAFIKGDQTMVSLVPIRRIANGAGGWVESNDPPRIAQAMRVIPTNFVPGTSTIDGEVSDPEFVLLGAYDADMEDGDKFLFKGSMLQVTSVDSKRDYETRGAVAYRGPATPADVEQGAAVSAYVLTQAVAATVWTFANPLGRLCDVNVFVGGESVMADVDVTNTTITITFSEAVSGQIVAS